MGKKEKLYQKQKSSPNNVSFREICTLAELVGCTLRQGDGSHALYKHDDHRGRLNFQSVKGKAKPYQVRQLIEFIEDAGLMEEEGKKE